MATVYSENPLNWDIIEKYVNQKQLCNEIFLKKKCFFYDACSFRYHANLDNQVSGRIIDYISKEDGLIIITRCVLMELGSRSKKLNPEYVQYIKNISDSGVDIYVIYEEELYDIMRVCFSTNVAVNRLLSWAVRSLGGPASTIKQTLTEENALYDKVVRGINIDGQEIYRHFFETLRANKEAQDNLGEELLAICLYILAQLPGEQDGKFCILTDDKGAAGKISKMFQTINPRYKGKRVIIFSTPKLAQRLFEEGHLFNDVELESLLRIGTEGKIKVLGTQIYDLQRNEISLTVEELTKQIIDKEINILF